MVWMVDDLRSCTPQLRFLKSTSWSRFRCRTWWWWCWRCVANSNCHAGYVGFSAALVSFYNQSNLIHFSHFHTQTFQALKCSVTDMVPLVRFDVRTLQYCWKVAVPLMEGWLTLVVSYISYVPPSTVIVPLVLLPVVSRFPSSRWCNTLQADCWSIRRLPDKSFRLADSCRNKLPLCIQVDHVSLFHRIWNLYGKEYCWYCSIRSWTHHRLWGPWFRSGVFPVLKVVPAVSTRLVWRNYHISAYIYRKQSQRNGKSN